jgi:hypothetical protein
MTIRRLGPKTQHDYIRHVKSFADFLGRSPAYRLKTPPPAMKQFASAVQQHDPVLVFCLHPVGHQHLSPLVPVQLILAMVSNCCNITIGGPP